MVTVISEKSRLIAIEFYLKKIADPQGESFDHELGQFVDHCFRYNLVLNDIEFGLDDRKLVDLLLDWCSHQPSERYQAVAQDICQMIRSDKINDSYLVATIEMVLEVTKNLALLNSVHD